MPKRFQGISKHSQKSSTHSESSVRYIFKTHLKQFQKHSVASGTFSTWKPPDGWARVSSGGYFVPREQGLGSQGGGCFSRGKSGPESQVGLSMDPLRAA
jgi:hypothetical protein